ncbi:lipocalin-like [Aulostomus maculatus]
MRNALPSLICVLVAYIYVAAACPDIKPVPNFNVQKMLGKWYLVGFATDQDWFMATKRDLKGSTIRAVPTIEGDMDLYNSNMGDDGLCWRLNYRAYRSDTPGRFVFKSKLWENDNDMRIVDTVYDRYAMVYAIQSKDGMDEALTMLWSKFAHFTILHSSGESLCFTFLVDSKYGRK